MTKQEPESGLSGDSVVVAVKDSVSCDLDGETVILNVPEGVYYGLDPVGTFIWQQIAQPRTINALRDAVLEEYEVEPDRCEADLLELIRDLASNRLVEVSHVARD